MASHLVLIPGKPGARGMQSQGPLAFSPGVPISRRNARNGVLPTGAYRRRERFQFVFIGETPEVRIDFRERDIRFRYMFGILLCQILYQRTPYLFAFTLLFFFMSCSHSSLSPRTVHQRTQLIGSRQQK